MAGGTDPDHSQWTLVIRPSRQWWDLRLGELWDARELIMLFVWRDFVSLYKQTILGPLWYIIQPLLTTVVFTVVFGRIAKLPTDQIPQFLFYMAGTVMWSYFALCLTKTSTTFITNAPLFGKVYFPRMTVPLSVVLSGMIGFFIQFLMFVCFVVYYMLTGTTVHPNAYALMLPLLVVLMASMGLGFGVLVSAVTTRYRDLQQLVSFGTSLAMYATPVIFPLSSVQGKLRLVVLLNPVTGIVEAFRKGFLGAGNVSPWLLTYSIAFVAVLVTFATLLFNRVERTFMDSV